MNRILEALQWLNKGNPHLASEILSQIPEDDAAEAEVALRAIHALDSGDIPHAWMLLADFVNERRAAV